MILLVPSTKFAETADSLNGTVILVYGMKKITDANFPLPHAEVSKSEVWYLVRTKFGL